MKKLFTLLFIAEMTLSVFAQAPQKMSYQCVVRNTSGVLIANHSVGIRISILQGSPTGTLVYQETYAPTPQTNANGLVTLEIGSGTPVIGTFSNINWSAGPYYLKTETDPTGGTSYTISGTSQLLTVPYSFYTNSAGNGFASSYSVSEKRPVLNLANGNIGIGAPSDPYIKLNVNGIVNMTPGDFSTWGVNLALDATSQAGGVSFGILSLSNGAGEGGGKFLIKNNSESSTFVMDNNGHTGINNLYPSRSLDVKGDINFTGSFLRNGNSFISPTGLVRVKGSETNMDSALFEVRNTTGQTVFAVYNEGVRIYVDDGKAKGATKGGFAIGSFDKSKVTSQPLFVVDPDSIRAYIDTGLVKTTKGGFAIGSFDNSKGGNINYFNVATDAGGMINPSQNRILWYPLKNAFLTGKVLIERPDSVGVNSFASGYESKAEGQYSQALGYKAIARMDYSTAIGKNAIANSTNSFSFGDGSKSLKNDSYAFGSGATSTGIGSYAFGSAGRDTLGNLTGLMTTASGDFSFAIGQGAIASNLGSFSFGANTNASGLNSVAVGYNSYATGNFSISIGSINQAIGYGSTAIGYETQATGTYSVALGSFNISSGYGSTTFGQLNLASGFRSTAIDGQTTASGDYSTATGCGTTASGKASTSMGWFTTAQPYASLVIGRSNVITGTTTSWVSTEPVFVIGNGTGAANRSNALTVLKNGNMTIAGTLTQNSDVRFKESITTLSNGLDLIEKINPVYFYFKDKNTHPAGRQIGFIAQEVNEVLPELVQEDAKGFLSVDYSKMSVVLLQAIKEQQKEIDELKTLVNTLVANQSGQGNK